LSFRNYADFAQRAPQMQLSLIDSVNSVLLRRTLAPSEYLPREIDAEKLIKPGQKIDIQLSIEDMKAAPVKSGGGWATFFTIIFVLVALGQFAWIKRAEILRLPAAQPLCAYLDCSVAEQRNPGAFRVLSRELEANKTDSRLLTLSLSFRNYADFAQRAPQMQLSLIDSVNSVLLRRTLAPSEYLPRGMDDKKLIEPGQKIDIQLSIEDPGPQASGFTIDFF
jgi:hypothetical protein